MNPDSLTMAPCPMSRPPDVIRAAHVITTAAIVVRPIANLNCDTAWVAVARVTGITGAVWARTRVTGAVPRTTIIISASACTDNHRKEKEQENRPFWPRFRAIPDGDRFRFHVSVINNVHLHIIIYTDQTELPRLNSTTSAWCDGV